MTQWSGYPEFPELWSQYQIVGCPRPQIHHLMRIAIEHCLCVHQFRRMDCFSSSENEWCGSWLESFPDVCFESRDYVIQVVVLLVLDSPFSAQWLVASLDVTDYFQCLGQVSCPVKT